MLTENMRETFSREFHIMDLRKSVLRVMTCIDNAACTDVNHLHHSKFIALRDDKPVKDVRREQPVG